MQLSFGMKADMRAISRRQRSRAIGWKRGPAKDVAVPPPDQRRFARVITPLN